LGIAQNGSRVARPVRRNWTPSEACAGAAIEAAGTSRPAYQWTGDVGWIEPRPRDGFLLWDRLEPLAALNPLSNSSLRASIFSYPISSRAGRSGGWWCCRKVGHPGDAMPHAPSLSLSRRG